MMPGFPMGKVCSSASSFPRKRESRNGTMAPAALDSRFRGNDRWVIAKADRP